jgi:hypothetical protein
VKLPLFGFIDKLLRKKATWEGLNPKTRKLVATLLVCGLYSLVATMACAVAVVYKFPKVEIFQILGLSSTFAWMGLTFLAIACNAAGAVMTRVETYQRHRGNLTVQKCVKGMFFTRIPALCVASYRAGNARARRSPVRSHASKDSSSDGESDSGEGDPPAPPYLSSLSFRPHLTFLCIYCKLNSFPFQWRSLFVPDCWYLPFYPSFFGRRWGK